jgi:predicted phosphodiesterase
MRVAALYDIHGNLPALEAVLHDLRRQGVDRIVVGGDVVPGPMSSEALDRVLDLGVPTDFIRGNGELAALAERAGAPSGVPEPHRDVVRWSGESLTPEQSEAIAAWPRTVLLRIPPLGDVLFCHATPRNENEIFTKLTREERLLEIFRGLDVTMVVCGHTHMQFDIVAGGVRVVNAGSVGMPFGAPGADWLLLGPGIDLRHTDYDLEAAAGRIRLTRYPKAEDFASRNLLRPPSEEQILAAYAQAAGH